MLPEFILDVVDAMASMVFTSGVTSVLSQSANNLTLMAEDHLALGAGFILPPMASSFPGQQGRSPLVCLHL
jgi:hypothetical protein